jgi:hypothetical protein
MRQPGPPLPLEGNGGPGRNCLSSARPAVAQGRPAAGNASVLIRVRFGMIEIHDLHVSPALPLSFRCRERFHETWPGP